MSDVRVSATAAQVEPVTAGVYRDAQVEPRGPRPRKRLSRRNIFLYGTLILVAVYYLMPLYVMMVTSLKGMPEIRLGNIFAPPVEITFEPWVKAWATACTATG
jgi:glucose/mannose transport system permease protein